MTAEEADALASFIDLDDTNQVDWYDFGMVFAMVLDNAAIRRLSAEVRTALRKVKHLPVSNFNILFRY